MKRRNTRPADKGAPPKWMVTYSDMITLILVFFILLFSMSQIDAEKFRALAEAFRSETIFEAMPSIIEEENPTENTEVLKEEENDDKQGDTSQANDEKEDNIQSEESLETVTKTPERDELDELLAEIEKFLNENDLNQVISAMRTDQGVVLILQESVLFETGEATVLDPAKAFLDKVSTLLSNIPNEVRVEGHTDNRPIASIRFPSNWELSGARASSVIRYILTTNSFNESRFISAGYGDTRPVESNNTSEGWSANRRVEIVILDSE
ncbi:flagellar motor rotation protein MotB [Gracilibacillus boraciitolerans JCM 21714]|uniref:Flagellar motor rotation protein MotB n=1 Tax=Gracilibacillus boraciitolerans JCM 21714 TaxID=1298598 RepID=W4VIE8_9BACI|nr:flagellar motor protein MotS [Gracilibacillus boraciitolerans]GAE92911.1 flagellar motor rotation protein MotB [Gracilibacillus boraciitolerans JCM 21714]